MVVSVALGVVERFLDRRFEGATAGEGLLLLLLR
jgi:hypothetical protein